MIFHAVIAVLWPESILATKIEQNSNWNGRSNGGTVDNGERRASETTTVVQTTTATCKISYKIQQIKSNKQKAIRNRKSKQKVKLTNTENRKIRRHCTIVGAPN